MFLQFRGIAFLLILLCVKSSDLSQEYNIDCGIFPTAECEAALALIIEAGLHRRSFRLFYFNDSSSTECLGDANNGVGLLQICTLRSLFTDCGDSNNSSMITLDDCRGWRCLGKETKEMTRCVMNLVGIQTVNSTQTDELKCGIPPTHDFLLSWGPPPWEEQEEIREKSHCLSNFPEGTKFYRRFGCEEGLPRVQYRASFPDRQFLRQHRGATCLIKQSCEGIALFQTKTICFDPVN